MEVKRRLFGEFVGLIRGGGGGGDCGEGEGEGMDEVERWVLGELERRERVEEEERRRRRREGGWKGGW